MRGARLIRGRLAGALLAGAILAGALLGGTAREAHAAKKIPDAPYYYVLDEPKALAPEALRTLQTLLIEHDHLTGEQFLVAIFNELDGEDLVDYTNRVFQQWRIGKRGKDNGVLLALYWKDHKARIEVGYGLEPVLTDAKSKLVLEEQLIPELKAGRADRALIGASLEILKIIESPLIESGKAAEILRSGGYRGGLHARGGDGGANSWALFLLIGIVLVLVIVSRLIDADAHYTSRGWYRPNPWRRSGGWGGGFGGGGFGGGGGGGGFGGGGFSGGGGSSGGGGASGSW